MTFAAAMVWLWTTHERPTDQEYAVAQRRGFDAALYHRGMELLKKAEAQGDLSERDWNAAKELAANSEPGIAHQGIACLWHMRSPEKRSEAIRLAQEQMKPGHPAEIRADSLAVLYNLRAPGWESIAASSATDPDLRYMCELIRAKEAARNAN